jgi:hypothetical protein
MKEFSRRTGGWFQAKVTPICPTSDIRQLNTRALFFDGVGRLNLEARRKEKDYFRMMIFSWIGCYYAMAVASTAFHGSASR